MYHSRSHETQRRKGTDPFRSRYAWWTEPGAIVLFVILVAAGVYIEFFALDLGYKNVIVIFGVFWAILTVITMMFYKKSQYESHMYVKEGVVERTKEMLQEHRAKVREDFVETELAVLARGEATTVLDSWRLHTAMKSSHRWLSRLELTEIDPLARELHIRVQLEHQFSEITTARGFEAFTLAEVLRFFVFVSGDDRVKALGQFFDCIILELYALREDDAGHDVSYPFFSLLILKATLPKLVSCGHLTLAQLQKFAEARFDGGRAIEPHRRLEPGAAQRGK
jgi:hypothetical protein